MKNLNLLKINISIIFKEFIIKDQIHLFFFTTIPLLAYASQMFTNYLVAHKITHEHYRKNPIHQEHWIMKHTIHRSNESKYYSDFIDHIYNTGTGQLL